MNIKTTITQLTNKKNLIKNKNQKYTLPTIQKKHNNLKSITKNTINQLK